MIRLRTFTPPGFDGAFAYVQFLFNDRNGFRIGHFPTGGLAGGGVFFVVGTGVIVQFNGSVVVQMCGCCKLFIRRFVNRK